MFFLTINIVKKNNRFISESFVLIQFKNRKQE